MPRGSDIPALLFPVQNTICDGLRHLRESLIRTLGTLVDGSLVRRQDRGDRVRFTMLSTVKEYIQSELDARSDARELRDRHAQWVPCLVRTWMEEVLDAGEPIEARSRAIALYFRGTEVPRRLQELSRKASTRMPCRTDFVGTSGQWRG
jgi:hypothetical protein